jgi:hypothetical protein
MSTPTTQRWKCWYFGATAAGRPGRRGQVIKSDGLLTERLPPRRPVVVAADASHEHAAAGAGSAVGGKGGTSGT